MADRDANPPSDETPPTSADDVAAPGARDQLQKNCDDEHSTYLQERKALTENELEQEKGYDTLLVTLSTLAIGSSFAIVKDLFPTRGGSALLVLAWIAFALCLFIALADKLLSYWTHVWYRKVLDAEFSRTPWTPGAIERARAAYATVPLIWLPPKFKIAGFVALLAGLVFLMLFVFDATSVPPAEDKPAPPPVIVNVYNGMPTTAPASVVLPTPLPGSPAPANRLKP